MRDEYPLEPGGPEMRALAARVADLVIGRIEALNGAPASMNRPSAELLTELERPPGEDGADLEELLEVTMRAAAAAYETAGPSYLAYVPGGGLFTSAVAEFLSVGLNRYTGRATPAPALVKQEESVLRWMCGLFGYPAGSQGLLTTGGSISNLIALGAARERHAEGRVDLATVYVGEHAHGSLAKAARTVGIGRERVRVVPSTPDLRLDVGALAELLEEDRRRGLIPVCVCAAAGTTNTGTVDPLGEAATLARDAGVWLHVDAAYGGFFQLTRRGSERLAGIDAADSITLDPHKSLFLPFGTGALVVREADGLRRLFAEDADYLQDLGDSGGIPDFDTLGPELTREYRGLRMWLPLHLHGVAAFRAQLDEKLDLARLAYERLVADERFETPWAPDLSIVPFRLAGADDRKQRELLHAINASQRVLLSSTRIHGKTYLRLAILSFRTHADRVREVLEIISEAADRLCSA